jgi:alpha-L-fucosidase
MNHLTLAGPVKWIPVFIMMALPLAAQDRLDWFQHDKFGMFIHFGPYSALAGEWRGQRVPVGNEAEWIMQRFNIPVRDYREAARGFDPVKFDAIAIVRLAKLAGMKYIVFTAKHHDGFAMYRSTVSPYNIVDWTRFGRDPLEELSEACRKEGIRLGVYYSHREDWDHPDGYGNHWNYDVAKKDFARYLREKSIPQMRELLTNYGPLGLVWFDRGIDTREQAMQFVNLVRELQPRCLINGRVGNYGRDLMGDYQNMSDNGMPSGGLEEYWETPQTLNRTWGYSRFDQEWKTPANVVQRLVEIVSKGGNYLLNIGPMGDGSVPAPSVAVLEQVGSWVQKYGESIYGSSACPLEDFPWGRCTVHGNRMYLHALTRPADGVLRIDGLVTAVKSAYPLAAPGRKLVVSRADDVLAVEVGQGDWDEFDTVIVLELAGPPVVEPPVITQGSDIPFELDYRHAITRGRAVKRFNREGGFHIAKWTGPDDSCEWRLLVSQPGRYRVLISYAAPSESSRRPFSVQVGEQVLDAKVVSTGEGYRYREVELGILDLKKAGPMTVRVRPRESGGHLMYLQRVVLRQVGGVAIE